MANRIACFLLATLTTVCCAQEQEKSTDSLPALISANQKKIVKVFGAGAGMVEAYSTGVVVDETGTLVTSQGVYLDGPSIQVIMHDGRVYPASILRRDRELQLALLKIDAITPDFFSLEESPPVQQGDWVVLMSNAFRVADKNEPVSAWLGIVSLPTTIRAMLTERDVAFAGELLVLDSITSNPGAAGGAAIAMDGSLVGVIGKIIESSETNTRLNYAIPARVVRDFIQGKAQTESASNPDTDAVPGKTGIRLFQLGGKSAAAYIDSVEKGSPAMEAGMRPDDLVISVDGIKTSSVRDCLQALEKVVAGRETVIVAKRGNDLIQFRMIAVER